MLRRMLRTTHGVTLALLLAACGGSGGAPTSGFPPGQWTWVPVSGTMCGDGSPTGIAVNPAPADSTDGVVLVVLDGGGACWGSGGFACPWYAEPGPFGAAELEVAVNGGLDAGTILDRRVTSTPFAGATLVFVPYCTGDVHWGDSEPTYPGYGVWHHAGKANLEKDVAWLKDHLEQPRKLVVAGSSAGGFGSLLAFDLARAAWPSPGTAGYLIDDSGPPLVGSDVGAELAGWYDSWKLDLTLDPVCGTGCQADLSKVVGALRERHPSDRIALLGSLQDATLSFFFSKTQDDYQDALLRLVDQSFPASPGTSEPHAFLVSGSGHALLSGFEGPTASGTALPEWIRQMVHGEDGWTTLGRPPP
jgi:hypothetical protein